MTLPSELMNWPELGTLTGLVLAVYILTTAAVGAGIPIPRKSTALILGLALAFGWTLAEGKIADTQALILALINGALAGMLATTTNRYVSVFLSTDASLRAQNEDTPSPLAPW